jgi:ferredoxin-NADP reductase
VLFEGPYGRFTGDARRCARITLIACGIGNTPIRALLEAEQYRPGDATLIHRARPARRGDEPAAMGCQDYGRIS